MGQTAEIVAVHALELAAQGLVDSFVRVGHVSRYPVGVRTPNGLPSHLAQTFWLPPQAQAICVIDIWLALFLDFLDMAGERCRFEAVYRHI